MADTDSRVNVALEIDSESDDLESIESDLTSLSSSVFNYVYENGRTYHAYKSGSYILPNDEKEQDRLDLLNHVFRLCLNGDLCFSQNDLNNPQKILDVGTGTGIWAIEMADAYPSAEITGVDLSPIQPKWVPPNVRFIIDDITQPWDFPINSFDFIHVRCLAGSITDWPEFLAQAYRHLKPGGTIELSEGRTHMVCDDGTYPETSFTYKWIAEFNRISNSLGRVFDKFPEFQGLLDRAGFHSVRAHEEPCPIGTWPKNPRLKEIGRYFRVQFLEGAVDSYSLALFTRYGGWSTLETEVLLAHVRDEIKSNKMHVYTHCSFATATKPLE
ncbi:phosphoethanolamine N-methyltransferase [Talaromyces pinophilus]|uniref:Phosphoethanolamine N-methyltransferase n=1 Tax=Talaromyces pinophilus TaxID=128442 RepID=A0A698XKT3_TALPI|nr:phosphoethanolamine N-methyltransferase [Talaromyces pinophilus]